MSYTAEEEEKEPTEPAPYLAPSPAAAPPPVATSIRPRLPATASSSSSPPVSHAFAPTPKPPKPPELHAPSYPPPESHSSAALSILHYILSHPFATPWFVHSPHSTSSPLPPPLVGRSDLRFTASWSQRNSDKQHVGAALFGDGSVAWWRLSWTAEAEVAGRAHLDARREGRYRPRPDVASWDAHALYAQSEALGTRVARFAEEAVERGVPVARGECWDMASEALSAAAAEVAKEDKPFPSIGRTHGALLFHARAGRDGTWTGGDAYVRPGDVVDWREVRISEVGARRGQYMVLGDPDVRLSPFLSLDDPARLTNECATCSTRPSSSRLRHPLRLPYSRTLRLTETRRTRSPPSQPSPSRSNPSGRHRAFGRMTWQPCPRGRCGSTGRARSRRCAGSTRSRLGGRRTAGWSAGASASLSERAVPAVSTSAGRQGRSATCARRGTLSGSRGSSWRLPFAKNRVTQRIKDSRCHRASEPFRPCAHSDVRAPLPSRSDISLLTPHGSGRPASSQTSVCVLLLPTLPRLVPAAATNDAVPAPSARGLAQEHHLERCSVRGFRSVLRLLHSGGVC